MRTNRYNEEQFIEAVKTSTSVRQVLAKLGLAQAGGGYATVEKFCKELNLDTSHFVGQGHNRGKTFGPKRPLEDYLSNKYPITSHKLKLRLLSEKIFERACSNCSLTEWLGAAIPLELHHKDGNHINNIIDNLCLLCPNCHALTDNYRGKNKR